MNRKAWVSALLALSLMAAACTADTGVETTEPLGTTLPGITTTVGGGVTTTVGGGTTTTGG